MAVTPKHCGVIKKGKFFPDDPRLYVTHFNSFKDGERVEVIVRKEQDTESDPMRKYYFGVVMEMMSEETDHSKEVIHADMKRRYASYVDDYGIMVIQSVFSHESTLTVDEKWTFIQNVRRWSSDFLNLSIPEPQKVA